MKGYKAFNSDLTCRGFQYEIGKTYEIDEAPIICKRGFHFCADIANCYKFYNMSEDTRICEIEAIGYIDSNEDEMKYCTNKIRIIKEITDYSRKANSNSSSSGYCNSGDCNSGNCNSGNSNSGYYNSGNCNSGDCNSGNWNSGDSNSGDYNSGNRNSGDSNSGNRNSGDYNSGNCNSGNWNSGDSNSGDYNSGNRNSGVFNTDSEPTIKMFDKDSNWTYSDWYNSKAYSIMSTCPHTHSIYIDDYNMTTKEKENHPEYKTIGGYIKTITVTVKDRQKWWNDLSTSDKEVIKSLPNFDTDKFCECVGINHI